MGNVGSLGEKENALVAGADGANQRPGCGARRAPEDAWLPLISGHGSLCGEVGGRQQRATEPHSGELPLWRRVREE